jgi:hypothetical protein
MEERTRRAAVVSVGMVLGLAIGGGAGGMPLGVLVVACAGALLVAFPAAYLLESAG